MSLTTDVLSFVLLAGLLTIIPGLDTAQVLRAAVVQGKKHAFATAFGINTGTLLWGAGAAVGVSGLLTASASAYAVLRLVGAVYMIWLGYKLLATAVRGGGDHSTAQAEAPEGFGRSEEPEATAWRSWRRGLLTNLLNPKVGAFYVAVLPQFIPAHASHLAVGLLLAFVHDIEGIVWFSAVIFGAHSLRRWMDSRSARRVTDGVIGSVLIGFGIKLGLQAR